MSKSIIYLKCNKVLIVFLCFLVMDSLNGLVCPPFGKTSKFEVMTIQSKLSMYGCAYMANRTQQSTVPLFHLWLERPEPTNVHGHCKNITSTYNEPLSLHIIMVGGLVLAPGCYSFLKFEFIQPSIKLK